ncbi:MAG: response regulator transcription factor [Bacteroidota bacterium]
MNVVIVDDSPIVRARLITMLDDLENVRIVGQAKSGEEALEVVSRINPDAMILDIRMPGLSGVDVLERLKKSHPNMRIIMITNFPYQQYRERCLAAGADHFFDKSTEFDKIIGVFAGAA